MTKRITPAETRITPAINPTSSASCSQSGPFASSLGLGARSSRSRAAGGPHCDDPSQGENESPVPDPAHQYVDLHLEGRTLSPGIILEGCIEIVHVLEDQVEVLEDVGVDPTFVIGDDSHLTYRTFSALRDSTGRPFRATVISATA